MRFLPINCCSRVRINPCDAMAAARSRREGSNVLVPGEIGRTLTWTFESRRGRHVA